jgi:glycosyltransferase involved in cell wall biosynthesis
MRLEALTRWQAPRAGVIVTPSEFSRADLIEAFKLDPDRVVVVPGAVAPVVEESEWEAESASAWASALDLRVGSFVLYLGNLHPRKNVARLIRAHVIADLEGVPLVIAGAPWWDGGGEQAEASRAPVGSVIFTGRVDQGQQQWLLRNARALAYPSLFEGFGLPPLEAMAHGTPTLVSQASALLETCGDAALHVDATDTYALAEGLQAVVNDHSLRERLTREGRERAAFFSPFRSGTAARRALQLVRDCA